MFNAWRCYWRKVLGDQLVMLRTFLSLAGADTKKKNLEGKTAAAIASNADVQAVFNRQTMNALTKARLSKDYADSDDEGSD